MDIKETATHFEANISDNHSMKVPKSRYTKDQFINTILRERKEERERNEFKSLLKSMTNEDVVKSSIFAYARKTRYGYSFYVKSNLSPSGVEKAFSLGDVDAENLLANTGNKHQYVL